MNANPNRFQFATVRDSVSILLADTIHVTNITWTT
jgi:hypothetical protein